MSRSQLRSLTQTCTVICLSCVGIQGCGPTRQEHLERAQNIELGRRRLIDIISLAKFAREPAVQQTLVGCLPDSDPAVRHVAATTIQSAYHEFTDPQEQATTQRALVKLLDDGSRPQYCVLNERTGIIGCVWSLQSIAELSHATLIGWTEHDFGFDKSAWTKYLDRASANVRYGSDSASDRRGSHN